MQSVLPRHSHRVARALFGLFAMNVLIACSQALIGMASLLHCRYYLHDCLEYTKRDPCIKMALPSFVSVLSALSMLVACCCQSTKSLAVLLLVNFLGESIMFSYVCYISQSQLTPAASGHFFGHLMTGMQQLCSAEHHHHQQQQQQQNQHPASSGEPLPTTSTEPSIVSCWHLYQINTEPCHQLQMGFLANCTVEDYHLVQHEYQRLALDNGVHYEHSESQSMMDTTMVSTVHADSAALLRVCLTTMKSSIDANYRSYIAMVSTTLLLSALAHFVLALAICVLHQRRSSHSSAKRSKERALHLTEI